MYNLFEADFIKGIPDYKKCDKCPQQAEELNGIYVDENGNGKICECKSNWKSLKRVERLLKDSYIPKEFWNFVLAKEYKNFATEIPEIMKYLTQFKPAIEKGINLYLHGEKYTYKTRIASFIGKMYMYFGYSVTYTTYVDCYSYIEQHRFTREDDNHEELHLLPLFSSQVFILDDLPQSQIKGDSFAEKMLVSVLKSRVQSFKNNIYISRFPQSQLVYMPELKQTIGSRTKEIMLQRQFKDNVVDNFFS